jgi:hypothetical protein
MKALTCRESTPRKLANSAGSIWRSQQAGRQLVATAVNPSANYRISDAHEDRPMVLEHRRKLALHAPTAGANLVLDAILDLTGA